MYKGRKIIFKRDITIGSHAKAVTIEPYFAISVYAIEDDGNTLILVLCWKCVGKSKEC